MEPLGKAALARAKVRHSGGRGLKICDIPFATNDPCDFKSKYSFRAMKDTVAQKKPDQDGRAMCVISSYGGCWT
jgi:hypothetical protein